MGNSYNKYLIQDLLREEIGYEGVVCTDWGITHDIGRNVEDFAGKCWGVEQLTEAERHLKALEAGVGQFGGNLAQYCTTKDREEHLNLVKGQLLLYPTLNMAGG